MTPVPSTYPNNGALDPNTSGTQTTGIPLRMDVTYQAMIEIRDRYHQRLDKAKLGSRTKLNYVSDGMIKACLGNTAAHWQDEILHFYCQLGQAT